MLGYKNIPNDRNVICGNPGSGNCSRLKPIHKTLMYQDKDIKNKSGSAWKKITFS